jgi:hypothetical protein
MSKWWKISWYSIPIAVAMAILLPVYLWFSGSKEQGMLMGLWMLSILAFAAYLPA